MQSNFPHTAQTGSRVIDKRQVPSMGTRVKKGLSLLEGSFPVDHLNPGLKHIVHYGRQTERNAILDWFSMFCFERNNKRIKVMVHHTAEPMSSVANHVELDILGRKELLAKKTASDFECTPTEILSVPIRMYDLSPRDKDCMQMLGVTSFRDFRAFKVAKVLGVHFRSGQWGRHRCSSVITTIHRGISRYCIVNAFFLVQEKAYAAVTWLTAPVYPCLAFKIVVKVRIMFPADQLMCPSVVPVDRIEPCTVSVMPDSDGMHFFMLRDKGIDRTV